MNDLNLVSITPAPSRSRQQGPKPRILLLKPPYFTPWTPPLGIAILKAFMEKHDYSVTCFDFNTDPELWGMHHKYFSIIQRLEDVSINDGYSKLWWILNAHLLAYANGADAVAIAKVLESVIPLYGIRHDAKLIKALIPVVDRYFKRLGEVIEQQLTLSDYGVVGTSTYTTSLASSLFLLKQIKAKNPRVTTVMGGGIFADDLALGSDNLDILIQECSFIDHVILGEGELLFLKLIEGELSQKRVITISDLKGSTLDMKDVPAPDFSDLELENYYHLSIEGARSCPFQCTFCSETIQWGDYRKKPMDQFAEQVVDLSNRFNIKEFFMGDSLMNPYINPFSLELIERKAGVLYDGYLRADKPVTNRKFVKLWADSGLFRVRLGIESAAAKVLNVMDKMTTPKVISDVLKTLASGGIRTTTYWIVGFPGETEADFQETCDFIREHHQYIYELEAHPYYYYPYGQVGSRLYQCSSLYPDEVTKYTKFKVWEIDAADPPREVRYERLRKLARICADLGLINIYTMNERYQAEDRWHRLHPLAVEVYQSGRVDRKPNMLSDVAIEAPREVAMFGGASSSAVICYEASVSKPLDERTLGAALVELINYNEVLQLNLRDGKYVADSNAETLDPRSLFSVYQLEATHEQGLEQVRARAIAELAREMRPARAASIRAALIKGDEADVELLLLVHRAIADAKSVTLLFEDLFRIYEQIANKRQISLRPIPKTSVSAITSLTDSGIPVLDQATPAKTTVIEIDECVMSRMLAKTIKDDGIHPIDVLTQAITRTLSQVKGRGNLDFDLRVDARIFDEQLKHTPGPLTRTIYLAGPSPVGQTRSDLLKTHQALRDALMSRENCRGTSDQRILLNCESCSEKPWLGQDQWKPKGFVSSGGPLASSYLLEVTPVEADRGLQVFVKYQESAAALAQALVDELVPEIDAILKNCESYAAAKEYWREEFATVLPRSSFFTQGDVPAPRTSLPISSALDPLALRELATQCSVELTTVILAVYSIVLSQFDGSEDLTILASPVESDGFVPLRITVPWAARFSEFAKQIQEKIGLAYNHRFAVFDVLAALPDGGPSFDAAYIFRDESETNQHANGKQSATLPESISQALKLTLEVILDWNGMTWRFNHDQGCIKPDTIDRLNSSFSSVLARVAKDIYIPLADAVLDTNEKLLFESSSAIEEFESSFSF